MVTTSSAGETVENYITYTLLDRMQNARATREKWFNSYKTKQATTAYPNHCSLGAFLHTQKKSIHDIHSSPKLKRTEASFSGWMFKQTLAHAHHGVAQQ